MKGNHSIYWLDIHLKEMDQSLETQPLRSSSRERKLTEKGREMQEQQTKKHKKVFSKNYDGWRELAREIRTKLKTFCSAEDLDKMQNDIKAKRALVHNLYKALCQVNSTTPDIVKKMDACIALTAETCDLISKRLEEVDKVFNDRLEKERVRMTLSKRDYGSICGETDTETVASECSESQVSCSTTSSKSSKRADAEAELAAKVAEAKELENSRQS